MFTPVGFIDGYIFGPGRRSVNGVLPYIEDPTTTSGTTYYAWQKDRTDADGNAVNIFLVREVTASGVVTREKALATWADRANVATVWIEINMPF